MTSKNLEKVIQRAISDAAFRRQLQTNPEAALRGFKLTGDEVAALRSGDAGRLMSLGIDQRMSKTFSVGADATMGAVSRVAPGNDLGNLGASVGDPNFTKLAGEATVGTPSGSTSALDPGYVDGSTSEVTTGTPSGSTSAIDPGFVSGATSASTPYGPYPEHGGLAGPSQIGGAEASTFRAIRDSELAGPDASAVSASETGDIADPGPGAAYIPPYGGSAATSGMIDPDSPEAYSPSFHATGDEAATSRAIRDSELAGPQAGAVSSGDIADPGPGAAYIASRDVSTSDALEDQSHAIAASRSADVEASTFRAIRDSELAGENAGLVAPVEGSPESFAFRDSAAPTSDQLEDQGHSFAAGRSADVEASTFRAIRDSELAGENAGLVAPVEGSPESFAFRDSAAPTSDQLEDQSHAFAAGRSADVEASTFRAIRDSELAGPEDSITRINDTGSGATSDALEDTSHAIAASQQDTFLTEGEATQYAADEGMLTDASGQTATTPDVDITIDDAGGASAHGGQEPEIDS